jgi:hypothetical protein
MRVAAVNLFDSPSADRWAQAIKFNNLAIELTQKQIEELPPTDAYFSEDRLRLLKVASYLNFIRTALLDSQSPLAMYSHAPQPPSNEDERPAESTS